MIAPAPAAEPSGPRGPPAPGSPSARPPPGDAASCGAIDVVPPPAWARSGSPGWVASARRDEVIPVAIADDPSGEITPCLPRRSAGVACSPVRRA